MRREPLRRNLPWWRGPDGEPGPVLSACLAAAIQAPSVHNTQPWLFEVQPSAVDVYADYSRRLAVADPAGRELVLSVGAAVFNLRVAVRAHGRTPVQVLESKPDTGRLARISPGTAVRVSEAARALAWAIPRRRSNRWPFTGVAPRKEVLDDLVAAAAAEGAQLRIPGRDDRRALLTLVRAAEEEFREDLAYRHELAWWSARRSERRDGITRAAAGPRAAPGSLALRDLGLAHPKRDTVWFESTPTIAVLHGPDSPQGWIRAGQALQRVLLTATIHGVATSLLTQPLEIPSLRALIADPRTGLPAQAIVRLGYSRRLASPSPRRPLAEVLRSGSDGPATRWLSAGPTPRPR